MQRCGTPENGKIMWFIHVFDLARRGIREVDLAP
jgi:hypothetical protein